MRPRGSTCSPMFDARRDPACGLFGTRKELSLGQEEEIGRYVVPDGGCTPEVVVGLFALEPVASPGSATGYPQGVDLRGLETWVEFTTVAAGPSRKKVRFDLLHGAEIAIPCTEIRFKARYGPPPFEVGDVASSTPKIEIYSVFGVGARSGVAGVGANARLTVYAQIPEGEAATAPIEIPQFARSAIVVSPTATLQASLLLRQIRSPGEMTSLAEAAGLLPLDTGAVPIVQGANFVTVVASGESSPPFVTVVFPLAIA